MEVPVFVGYLNILNQSGFALNLMPNKKSCRKYCLLFKASRHGVERLELCESKEDKNPKIITLENCIKITKETYPVNCIYIVKKTGALTLNTLNEIELKQWTRALQTVAFTDKSRKKKHVFEEHNEIYCSSFEDGLFIVSLIPSYTSIRCNIESKVYTLQLTATDLQLKSAEDLNATIANWPYRFIRKYGYREGQFTFEAGRKCNTGEGDFIFDHTNPQEVFRCMSSKMKSMKKLLSGESTNNVNCLENQLCAVAFMEAGSRSPVPPSSSNQHFSDFEIQANQDSILLRELVSSTDSLNGYSANSISKYLTKITSLKSTSNKPSRKLPISMKETTEILNSMSVNRKSNAKIKKSNNELVAITTTIDPNKSAGSTVILNEKFSSTLENSFNTPFLPIQNEEGQTSSDRFYESIELITDAWKTLGVCDVMHTENSVSKFSDDYMNYLLPRNLSHVLENPDRNLSSSKIVDIDIGEGEGMNNQSMNIRYDRLDFLSPNNKALNGYKTIVTLTTASNAFGINNIACNGINDYELIMKPQITSCQHGERHHGYGILNTGALLRIPIRRVIRSEK